MRAHLRAYALITQLIRHCGPINYHLRHPLLHSSTMKSLLYLSLPLLLGLHFHSADTAPSLTPCPSNSTECKPTVTGLGWVEAASGALGLPANPKAATTTRRPITTRTTTTRRPKTTTSARRTTWSNRSTSSKFFRHTSVRWHGWSY